MSTFGDGELQKLYEEYRHRLDEIGDLNSNLPGMDNSRSTLVKVQTDIACDLQFIHDHNFYICTESKNSHLWCTLFFCIGLSSANREYSESVSSSTTSEKTLHNLGWKVDELSRLDKAGRQLTV